VVVQDLPPSLLNDVGAQLMLGLMSVVKTRPVARSTQTNGSTLAWCSGGLECVHVRPSSAERATPGSTLLLRAAT